MISQVMVIGARYVLMVNTFEMGSITGGIRAVSCVCMN